MRVQMYRYFANNLTMVCIQVQILIDIQPLDVSSIITRLKFDVIKYGARIIVEIIRCCFNPCIIRITRIINVARINFRAIFVEELFNFIDCEWKYVNL